MAVLDNFFFQDDESHVDPLENFFFSSEPARPLNPSSPLPPERIDREFEKRLFEKTPPKPAPFREAGRKLLPHGIQNILAGDPLKSFRETPERLREEAEATRPLFGKAAEDISSVIGSIEALFTPLEYVLPESAGDVLGRIFGIFGEGLEKTASTFGVGPEKAKALGRIGTRVAPFAIPGTIKAGGAGFRAARNLGERGSVTGGRKKTPREKASAEREKALVAKEKAASEAGPPSRVVDMGDGRIFDVKTEGGGVFFRHGGTKDAFRRASPELRNEIFGIESNKADPNVVGVKAPVGPPETIPEGMTWVRLKPKSDYAPETPSALKPNGAGQLIPTAEAAEFGSKVYDKVVGKEAPKVELEQKIAGIEKRLTGKLRPGDQIQLGGALLKLKEQLKQKTEPIVESTVPEVKRPILEPDGAPKSRPTMTAEDIATIGAESEFGIKAIEARRAAERKAIEVEPIVEPTIAKPFKEETPPPKEPPGTPREPQGARSGDFEPSGIKNAIVDLEREAKGLDKTRGRPTTIPEVEDFARRQMEADPFAGEKLVTELVANPRPHTGPEAALLVREKGRLEFEEVRAADALEEAARSGNKDRLKAAQEVADKVEADILRLDEIGGITGTESGQGLYFRRLMTKENYGEAHLIQLKRNANQGKLTEAQEARTKAESKAIRDAEKEVTKKQIVRDDKGRTAANETAIEEAKAEAGIATPKPTEPGKQTQKSLAERVVESLESAAIPAKVRLKDKLNRLGANVDPTIIADMVVVGSAKLARTTLDFAQWSAEMIRDLNLGPNAQNLLEEVWEGSKKKIQAAGIRVKEGGTKKARPEAKGSLPIKPPSKREVPKIEGGDLNMYREAQRLIREAIGDGILGRKEVNDYVHAKLLPNFPDIVMRDTIDAIGGYGRFTLLNKDAISLRQREIRGENQQLSKLEDLEQGKPLQKTGQERPVKGDEQRRLEKQVNESKRRHNVQATDPETQLRSALDGAKTRARNELSDLEFQITNKEKIVKDKTSLKVDEELKALRNRLVSKRAEFRSIFEPKLEFDPVREANAIMSGLQSSIRGVKQKLSGSLAKSPFNLKPSTPMIRALEKEKAALQAEWKGIQDILNPKKTVEERQRSALKAKLLREDAAIEGKIARGEFEPKPKAESPVLDKELTDLQFKLQKKKQAFHEGVLQDRLSHRDLGEVIGDGIGEVANLMRSYIVAYDLSGAGRQGLPLVLTHPVSAFRAYGDMIRALRKEEGMFKVMKDIEEHPNFNFSRQVKLDLTEISQALDAAKVEEVFRSRWAKKIPGVEASNRAYVTFLNKLRFETFNSMVEGLGGLKKISQADGQFIANYVNTMTGRSTVLQKVTASKIVSGAMFAPRLLVSRFQVATGHPLWALRGKGVSAAARKAVAIEYAKILGGMAAFYSLAIGVGGAEVEIDPRSSDFMKLRWGDTRLDPSFGLASTVVFATRFVTGQTKSLKRGRIYDLRGRDSQKFGARTSLDEIIRFGWTKLSPAVNLGASALAGHTVVGDPFTAEEVAKNILIPMAPRDIIEAMMDQGFTRGAAIGAFVVHGFGAQTFDPTRRKRPPRGGFFAFEKTRKLIGSVFEDDVAAPTSAPSLENFFFQGQAPVGGNSQPKGQNLEGIFFQ